MQIENLLLLDLIKQLKAIDLLFEVVLFGDDVPKVASKLFDLLVNGLLLLGWVSPHLRLQLVPGVKLHLVKHSHQVLNLDNVWQGFEEFLLK